MYVALTGTPGTGKSTIAGGLEDGDPPICDVQEIANRSKATVGYDADLDSWEVDIRRLAQAIPKDRPQILVGHLAHHREVAIVIVLPGTLRQRLEKRGWSPEKADEHVEAEALGVIANEAMPGTPWHQLDTTATSPLETLDTVEAILMGQPPKNNGHATDWSEVILSWSEVILSWY